MGTVTVIQPTINQATFKPLNLVTKKRVCAYARVSTDSDEQLTSYEAQIDYYEKYIKANPNWEFVKVYTDKGISGTNTKYRDSFNEMIRDALNGKIDLIVTKSVSRFARNTVDSLTTIRKLKEKGVECFFQKENIYSLDSKGELMLTIMSSLAQEESRSISQNVTWGHRKQFSDGHVYLPYARFLGYKKGADGKPEVVEEEAEIVRHIYSLFMRGYSLQKIKEDLDTKCIKTPSGKGNWCKSTIKSILTNEKYKGEAILQKAFTVDFLTHKTKKNEGEVPQYYVKDSHESIIKPEEWEAVQVEMKRREKIGSGYSSSSVLANKIICEDCGSFYGPKVWHSTDKWKKVVWQCNSKFKNDRKCRTATLNEEDIKSAFIKAYNQSCFRKNTVLEECELIIKTIDNIDELNVKLQKLNDEDEATVKLAESLIKENSTKPQDQTVYSEKYKRLEKRHNELETEIKLLCNQIEEVNFKISSIKLFIDDYKKSPSILEEWSDELFTKMVEKVVVNNTSLAFWFYSGHIEKINIIKK